MYDGTIAIGWILIHTHLLAQQQPGLPRADCSSPQTILQRYINAVGGEAALGRTQTRVIEASETEPYSFKPNEFATYEHTIKWKAPRKVAVTRLHVLAIPGAGRASVEFRFNGHDWSNSDGRASRNEENTQPRIRKLRADVAYNDYPDKMMWRVVANPLMVAGLDRMYVDLAAAPDQSSSSLCAVRATAVDQWGAQRNDTLYFGAQDGLLTRWEIQLGAPPNPRHVNFEFGDYRQAGAVKIPFEIYFDLFKARFRLTKVIPDMPIPDQDFEPKQP